jgi:hypothetical protein
VLKIIGRELDRGRAEVLVEAVQLGGPGDRHDPGPLDEQPRKRDLCRRRSLLTSNVVQEADQRPVRLARVGCKSW